MKIWTHLEGNMLRKLNREIVLTIPRLEEMSIKPTNKILAKLVKVRKM